MSELTQAPRICLTFTFHPSRAVVSNNNYLVPQWQSAGDVRLVNGTSPSNGVVQLYLDLKNGRAGWASECSQLSQVAIELIEGSYHIGYYVTNPPDPSTGYISYLYECALIKKCFPPPPPPPSVHIVPCTCSFAVQAWRPI